MFQTICDLVPVDPDVSVRARRLDILGRVLEGTLYDVLPFEFHEERSGGGEYIPLRRRRPSVRYGLCRVVVEDSVALLFSEGHFPGVESENAEVRGALARIVRDCRLNQVMTEAAIRGSVGSSAVLMRVLGGRVFLDVLETAWLVPHWEAEAPDVLRMVVERYKVPGAELVASGFEVEEPAATYWFERRWDAEEEVWCKPLMVGSAGVAVRDEERTRSHGLGFVPIVWIRNLPGGAGPDGACTFRAAVETGIEIDYQLSQAGRGLKYSSDPTLLIKEPAGIEGDLVRGAANALVVSEKGDARLLEINGTAAGAVLEYVRMLRELALEGVHGNRADASRLSVRRRVSGRALELMNQGLIWLADQLRVFLRRGRGAGGAAADLAGFGAVYPIACAGGAWMLRCAGCGGGALRFGVAGLVSGDFARTGLGMLLRFWRWLSGGLVDRAVGLRLLARGLGGWAVAGGVGWFFRPSSKPSPGDWVGSLAFVVAELGLLDPHPTLPRKRRAGLLFLCRFGAGLWRTRLSVAVLRERLVQAELRTEAVRAGMVDLDGVKLIDKAALVVDEAGCAGGWGWGDCGVAGRPSLICLRRPRVGLLRRGRWCRGRWCRCA